MVNMKKIFCITFCFLFVIISLLIINFSQTKTTDASSISGYAQIIYNNVYLYKFPSESSEYSSKYCLLEPTYFVKILAKVNDYFYKVEYLNLTGYVKIEQVEIVENTPVNPYLKDIVFDITNKNNAILRSEPTTENKNKSIVSILNSGTKNINYIGKIAGEESLAGCGNVWYFCSVTDIEGKVKQGYIYAPLTSNLSPILQNEEPVTLTSANTENYNNLLNINLSTQNLTLIVLSLPSLLIIYLFIKPSKIINKKVNNKN